MMQARLGKLGARSWRRAMRGVFGDRFFAPLAAIAVESTAEATRRAEWEAWRLATDADARVLEVFMLAETLRQEAAEKR
jgi:hypothetical protein